MVGFRPAGRRDRRTLVIIASVLLAFLTYYFAAQYQVFTERMRLLHTLAVKRDQRAIQKGLAEIYEDAGLFGDAISHYRKSLPNGWNKGTADHDLFPTWERLDHQVPFDPRLHIGFGEFFESQGMRKQAALEYWQAMMLSPGHQNTEAESKLVSVAQLKAGQTRPTTSDLTKLDDYDRWFDQDFVSNWRPPAHKGFLLTRCSIRPSDCNLVKVTGPSGSILHDYSAVTFLRSKACRDRLQTNDCCFISYSVALMSDGDAKFVNCYVYGFECNLVETSQWEIWEWQAKELLRTINRRLGIHSI